MVYKATAEDASGIAGLANMMWEGAPEELKEHFEEVISGEEGDVFITKDGKRLTGFAHCQLRHDYVEGTESSPVGYLEGIFVRQEYRKQGLAKELLQACESWAAEKGCQEFASDCGLDNNDSLQFHLKLGFTEANRIICFTKKL